MSSYTNYLSSSRIYAYVWIKYRPAILKLMSDSSAAPQEYKFSKHEIKSVNPNEKGGYSFVLRVHKGKALNDVRKSAIAKDLLSVLQQSNRAVELLDLSTYEFRLDKNFVLHITKEEERLDIASPELPIAETAEGVA